jgi:carotenoid cleavage dioxygenase-like enzyme
MAPSASRPQSDDHAAPWRAGFASLEQEFEYRVDEIDGRVPPALRGTLFRNGSGRNELNGQWFPHWFDGDGMISAIAFDDNGIRYLNRYVRTDNYVNETREGRVPLPRLRQVAAGRHFRQRIPAARQCVEHLGRAARRPAAVALGGRRALCARSQDAQDLRP